MTITTNLLEDYTLDQQKIIISKINVLTYRQSTDIKLLSKDKMNYILCEQPYEQKACKPSLVRKGVTEEYVIVNTREELKNIIDAALESDVHLVTNTSNGESNSVVDYRNISNDTIHTSKVYEGLIRFDNFLIQSQSYDTIIESTLPATFKPEAVKYIKENVHAFKEELVEGCKASDNLTSD